MAAQTSLVWMLIISLGLINDSFSQHKTIILNEVSYSSELKSAENNIGFYAFYGIPYARQPVGRFRFTRPAPIEELFSWNLSIDEIKKYYHTPRTMPKACAQIDPFTNMTDLTTSSEDCLRVDLYITNKVWLYTRIRLYDPSNIVSCNVWLRSQAYFEDISRMGFSDVRVHRFIVVIVIKLS